LHDFFVKCHKSKDQGIVKKQIQLNEKSAEQVSCVQPKASILPAKAFNPYVRVHNELYYFIYSVRLEHFNELKKENK